MAVCGRFTDDDVLIKHSGCGNKEARALRIHYDKKGNWCECDKCGLVNAGIADVYFDKPYFDEHLADSKHKEGQWINSKAHKAQVLREQGLVEAGDRFHGARTKHVGENYGERKLKGR